MEQKIIEIKDLSVHFKTMDGDVKAVNDVSLSVRRGHLAWSARPARGKRRRRSPFFG